MKNFKLIDKINTDFILEEITKVININMTINERDPNHVLHFKSSWKDIVSPFRFSNEKLQVLSSEHSSYLCRSQIYSHFPKTISYINSIAKKKENSIVQRISIAILSPHGNVLPHEDSGVYYKPRDRYHIVVKSKNGSKFFSGDEEQIFKEGEVWWFANKETHSVLNLSDVNRIHIIFDLLPKNHFNYRQKIVHYIYTYFFQKSTDVLGVENFTKLIEKQESLARELFYSK